MPLTAQDYINQVRRLLKDSSANFWGEASDPTEVFDDINEARKIVAADTKCLQTVQTVTLTIGQEKETFPTITGGDGISTIRTIILDWGNGQKYPLDKIDFTELHVQGWRTFNTQSRPVMFAIVEPDQVYFTPIPNSAYSTEWHIVYLPDNMTQASDIETKIKEPFSTVLVKFKAAEVALLKDRALEEAQFMRAEYRNNLIERLSVYNDIGYRYFRND